MSNSINIIIAERHYEEFVSIEHGNKYISLSLFDNDPIQCKTANITPEQAIQIANELIKRAKQIKEGV